MKTLVTTLFLLLTACAGTPFQWDSARKISPGMTAREVTDLIGPPYLVKSQGDTLLYVWSYADTFSGAKSLSIEFKDNKVMKAPPIPDSF